MNYDEKHPLLVAFYETALRYMIDDSIFNICESSFPLDLNISIDCDIATRIWRNLINSKRYNMFDTYYDDRDMIETFLDNLDHLMRILNSFTDTDGHDIQIMKIIDQTTAKDYLEEFKNQADDCKRQLDKIKHVINID